MALPVRVRFATEPSGYLDIVDAKAALLNKLFAERYDGELIVRFDDTKPGKGSNECVDNILKDIETLGINYDQVTYASDYFLDLMLMAEKLIGEGKAYVDDTEPERMREERRAGIESRCRNQSVDENLKLWEKEMVAGTERGLKCCLRGKLEMQNPNTSLRDPVYYFCSLVLHHRVGSDYKVYPTYDFASPFVDSKQGITHALRSVEYHDRIALYDRVLMDMGLGEVRIYEFSRLNLVNTVFSKRMLRWFVHSGLVDGLDDPRFPTVQGIVRRGLKPEVLFRFISEQGASKRPSLTTWDKLWSMNKKMIDPVCPRHTAVIKERRVLFTLTNGPCEPFVRMVPLHKKREGAGVKEITFAKSIWVEQADAMAMSVDEEVSLMDWGNAIVKTITKDEGQGIITAMTGILHLEGSVKTTKLKLTWLPDSTELVSHSSFPHVLQKHGSSSIHKSFVYDKGDGYHNFQPHNW